MRFRKGDRVALSREAVTTTADEVASFRDEVDRVGTVVGFSRSGVSCRVLWDGWKCVTGIHESFLRLETEKEE